MIKGSAREIKYFLFGQELADGLRTTLAILLPALLLSFVDQLELGMAISLGALCINITDAPGPIIHKRNSMLAGLLVVFVMAIITGYARMNVLVLGAAVVVFSFFFSMFNVYGARATAVGSAGLLVLILVMDQPIEPLYVIPHSFAIAAGGVWYLLIALLSYSISPYRPPQRALGQCIRELAQYLSIKADFYNPATDLEEDYRRLVAQQIVVSTKQDTVREMLFKSRQIVKETTYKSSALLLTFTDTVDMFEDVTATYYDYYTIRKRFADDSILHSISTLIKSMADELDRIGMAIVSNTPPSGRWQPDAQLDEIKQKIDAINAAGTSSIALKKILVNIRRLTQRIHDISEYFNHQKNKKRKGALEYHRFVTHQSYDPKILLDNLTFKSSIFRHSLRVAIACLVGFSVAKIIDYGHHTYWILLTIAFMLKPAYGLTKQRNVERIVGTVAGGLIGVLILLFIQSTEVQFALMLLFMLGTYSFQRTHYIVMVICVTPFVLILFKFVGAGFIGIAQERLLDTVIGCAIAFTASYLLFPNWEKEVLKDYMRSMLKANLDYLNTFVHIVSGRTVQTMDYKLVRKEVYVSSANLSAAFQRMVSEPKSKQENRKQVHQFVVLNHILFSNIAALTGERPRPDRVYPDEVISLLKRALSILCGRVQKLDESCDLPEIEPRTGERREKVPLSADDLLLKDQLEFIVKISTDLDKITGRLTAAGATTQ